MVKIVSLVFTVLDMLAIMGCSVSFLHAIPREKDVDRWKKVIAWIFYGVLATVLPLFRNDILTTVVMTLFYVGIGRTLYYKNKTGILYQIIFWMEFLAAQYMAAYAVAVITMAVQVEYPLTVVLLIILRVAFLMAVTFVMRRLLKSRYTDAGKELKIRGMIIVPVFSTALMFLYAISGEVFLVRYGYGWMLLFDGLLIVINVYCLYFWYDVAKNRELKHRLKLIQQQNELTLQYYEDLEDNYSRSRKIIHDIRNHLTVLEQAEKMENSPYIEDMHAMLNSLGMKFYAESKMLNIVLNDKFKEFLPEHVECRLGGISLEFISDMDITTIFANLLDNAVEAQPDRETRSIRIQGEQIHDFTMIKLTNPFAGECSTEGTTKKGHEGLGLTNVRGAVEKYGGEMQVTQADHMFAVTLVFPEKLEKIQRDS